jgi:hypothetical protein
MDEKTLKNLSILEQMFQNACQVCDPLDYEIRQRNLIYTIANFCLIPLAEYREEQKKKEDESKLAATNEANHAVESV